MTISSLLSSEQITGFSVEITGADFNRIEVIGDLIRHTEIVDVACPKTTLARTSLRERMRHKRWWVYGPLQQNELAFLSRL